MYFGQIGVVLLAAITETFGQKRMLLGLIELANPDLPSLGVGLFGLRAYLMYVPLMYIAPAALGDAAALRR